MKSIRLFLPLTALFFAGMHIACEDDVSSIGDSLTSGDISINLDTLEYDLQAISVENKSFDARSGSLMMGNLVAQEYGSLNCSFVTRLMPATTLPDSLFSPENFYKLNLLLDSCKVNLSVARTNFTGDSLAPQKVSVYRLLEKQLPLGITNDFNPQEYYGSSNMELLGTRNYTMSLAGENDSVYYRGQVVRVNVNVPNIGTAENKEFPLFSEIFDLYLNNKQAFIWPQNFAKYFPGLYVQTTFGKGCVSNVTDVSLYAYIHHVVSKTEKDEDGEEVTVNYNVADSICLACTAPEVLSSNIISYKPSESLRQKAAAAISTGKTVVTTPGGYVAKFKFPVKQIIEDYKSNEHNLAIINALSMLIPADTIQNDFDLTGAPYLLMIKTSEVDEFFAKNKVPDNITSFATNYSLSDGGYVFSGLRQYLMDMLSKDTITDDDIDFSLIPVSLTTETPNSYYSSTTYVTKCVPYLARPTMMTLDTGHAKVMFNFSSQIVQ